MSRPTSFDPARHLTLVSGKEYLEAKWRLVWLRSEAPNSRIETEIVDHGDGWCIFKATVTEIGENGEVLGVATGHAYDDAQGFKAYLEKAETAAISRALAALGYGTQFSTDFDDANRIADAPVQFRQDNAGNYRAENQQRTQGGNGQDDAASAKQMGAIYAIGKALEFEGTDSADFAFAVLGVEDIGNKNQPKITGQQASKLIKALDAEKQKRGIR